MRLFKTLALTGILAVAGTACADLEVTNLNAPDRERAISTPNDVEALISGSFQSWWAATHYSYPSSALSVAADAHSSSWGNWGMRDSGNEPRNPYNNEPSYTYNNIAETPWGTYYAALAAIRDGLLAIEGGIEIGNNGADTQRAIAFGRMVQGMSHAYIALLFDKGFVVDETSQLESLEFQDYNAIFSAAMGYLAEAEQLAGSNSFTIPASWIGFDQDWDSGFMQRFIRSYRARLTTQIARTPAERDALNWAAIMSDAQNGIGPNERYGSIDQNGNSWAWMRQKLHTAGYSGWARIDNRTVGPADTQGSYGDWLAASPENKFPFNIVTTDTRITQPNNPSSNGSLIRYLGSSPFPASRGIYHYSNYLYDAYNYIVRNQFVNQYYPDFEYDEAQLIIAEAAYRMGDFGTAIDIVNASRAKGNLPPLEGTGANAVAPGGVGTCVPMNDGRTCADLLEALKYEKRIELFHRGLGTEYFDDRGWGDLVTGTWQQLPIPGAELLLLLEDIYTFGGVGMEGGAPALVDDLSPEALASKRQAFERYREALIDEERSSVIAY